MTSTTTSVALVDRMNVLSTELNLNTIAGKELDWTETLDHTSRESVSISDVHNDLVREMAFYQQGLDAVLEGRERILKAGLVFTRPTDFFAEMVKPDSHMLRVRKNILEEAQSMKKSEEAKKLRELKKFGKKVQVQKMQDRQKAKTDMLSKIDSLKKKRGHSQVKDASFGNDDEFDIALEKDKEEKPNKRHINKKRQSKDTKFGFGGKKRNIKSNTKQSTNEFDFSVKKNKREFQKGKKTTLKKQRPGKSVRRKMKK